MVGPRGDGSVLDARTRGAPGDVELAHTLWQASVVGTEMKWTDDIPLSHRAEAIGSALEEASSSCPEVASAHRYLDCDEYPCMLWVETARGRPGSALEDCPTWNYEMWLHGYEWTADPPAGEGLEVAVYDLRFAPMSEEQTTNFELRVGFRRDFQRPIVAEEWAAARGQRAD